MPKLQLALSCKVLSQFGWNIVYCCCMLVFWSSPILLKTFCVQEREPSFWDLKRKTERKKKKLLTWFIVFGHFWTGVIQTWYGGGYSYIPKPFTSLKDIGYHWRSQGDKKSTISCPLFCKVLNQILCGVLYHLRLWPSCMVTGQQESQNLCFPHWWSYESAQLVECGVTIQRKQLHFSHCEKNDDGKNSNNYSSNKPLKCGLVCRCLWIKFLQNVYTFSYL